MAAMVMKPMCDDYNLCSDNRVVWRNENILSLCVCRRHVTTQCIMYSLFYVAERNMA